MILRKLKRFPLIPLLAIKNNSYSYRFKNIARNFNSNISGVNYSFLKESFFDNDDFDNLLEIIDETFEVPNKKDNYQLTIVGNTFKTPKKEINCQNSGTTMRLLSGLLSFKKIKCSLIGDSS